ncbi:hypothetical protein HZA71_00380 [Candidatus Falkowbacteria bacterium]|nr:hypothetical protein [Candidatus Falkowbacteria bacterium]
MMITINLLSPQQKEETKTKRIYSAIKESAMLILLFTSIIAILLVISKYMLDEQLANLILKNAVQIQASQVKNNQIIAVNKKLNTIANIQKNFVKWSGFFVKLSQMTPENIQYGLVKVYYQDAALELEGAAKTRQDLLKLKKQLENSGLFANVDLPLGDLLAKENNIFHIKAKMNLNELSK